MTTHISPTTLDRVEQCLRELRRADRDTLGAKAGLARRTILHYLRALHRAGRIYIAAWRLRATQYVMIYAPQPLKSAHRRPDQPRPARMTPSETMRRWRRRNPERYARDEWLKKCARSVGRNVRLGLWGI